MAERDKKTILSVAPMMDWTDRHCRYFHRLISPHAFLYTEMVTTGALLHGDRERFLRFAPAEHPIALQLGGCDPAELASCGKFAAERGYDEINLNCGCPSDRVQKGRFGACLMRDPALVAACIKALNESVAIPVSIKCRIGIDDLDSYEFLEEFISKTSAAGCKKFIIHARKAWLSGLSPKENRDVPNLDYARVHSVKRAFPHAEIILNGGLKTLKSVKEHLHILDGVMIGREAYQNPYFLAEIEREIFETMKVLSREDVALAMIPYAQQQYERFGTPVKSITRHMTGLFHQQPGAKIWRRYLSENAHEDGAGAQLIVRALEAMKKGAKHAA